MAHSVTKHFLDLLDGLQDDGVVKEGRDELKEVEGRSRSDSEGRPVLAMLEDVDDDVPREISPGRGRRNGRRSKVRSQVGRTRGGRGLLSLED